MKKLLSRLVLYRTNEEVDFSFRYFVAFVIIQTVVFMAIVYAFCDLLGQDLIRVQVTASPVSYLVCFAAIHLVMSLFEFLFHRYTLHKVVFSGLATFKRKHGEHHALTHVRALNTNGYRDGAVGVRNKYAIVEPEQIKSSAFPGYALAVFWCLFSALIVPLQLVFPALPALTAGYLAVVFSFSLYEIIHAIEHLNYEKYWKRWIEQYPFIREIYGFHLMHHSNELVNQAIGGFFGLPVWDWLFGTYFVPDELPLPGARVRLESQKPPPPRQPIRWLDGYIARVESRSKERRKRLALSKHDPK